MQLSLLGVTHSYRGGSSHERNSVLCGLDLEVPPGSRFAIMGPSGSGKTTLLSILGLLMSPTAGEVQINGEAVTAQARRATRIRAASIGWVFQTANVLLQRSAVDNVALSLAHTGMAHSDTRPLARAALKAVGLEKVSSHSAGSLSGGERQRVCIARALVRRPELILADEPTAQLDRQTTIDTMDAMLAAMPRAASLVVATHDSLVAERCGSVLQLVDGRMTV